MANKRIQYYSESEDDRPARDRRMTRDREDQDNEDRGNNRGNNTRRQERGRSSAMDDRGGRERSLCSLGRNN